MTMTISARLLLAGGAALAMPALAQAQSGEPANLLPPDPV